MLLCILSLQAEQCGDFTVGGVECLDAVSTRPEDGWAVFLVAMGVFNRNLSFADSSEAANSTAWPITAVLLRHNCVWSCSSSWSRPMKKGLRGYGTFQTVDGPAQLEGGGPSGRGSRSLVT